MNTGIFYHMAFIMRVFYQLRMTNRYVIITKVKTSTGVAAGGQANGWERT